MTGWIRSCRVLIWIALAIQAVGPIQAVGANQAMEIEDAPANPPSSPLERKLDYALRIAKVQSEFAHNNVARARQLLQSCPQDLRRWEWRYLYRLCNSELQSVQVP